MKKNQFLTIIIFSVLEEVIPDPDISIDNVSMKSISTSFNIAKELKRTSMSEVRKSLFSYVTKNILIYEKLKMKLYKAIKGSGSNCNLKEFEVLA